MINLLEDINELDLEPTHIPTAQDGMAGAEEFTNKMIKELEDCGYTNIKITTLYPRRLKAEWYYNLQIEIVKFEYRGLTFKAFCGGNGIQIRIKIGNNYEYLHNMADLEEYGVVDDETISQFVHEQEDVLGNEDMFEDNDCFFYWNICNGQGEEIGVSWELGVFDAFDINTLFDQLTDTTRINEVIQYFIEEGKVEDDFTEQDLIAEIDNIHEDLELEPSTSPYAELNDFIEKVRFDNDYSSKALDVAKEVIKESIENDWVDDDGTILLDELYEWTQFDNLQEIFDYIEETSAIDFEEEIRYEDCDPSLYGVYNTKLYNEVYRLIDKFNDEVILGN